MFSAQRNYQLPPVPRDASVRSSSEVRADNRAFTVKWSIASAVIIGATLVSFGVLSSKQKSEGAKQNLERHDKTSERIMKSDSVKLEAAESLVFDHLALDINTKKEVNKLPVTSTFGQEPAFQHVSTEKVEKRRDETTKVNVFGMNSGGKGIRGSRGSTSGSLVKNDANGNQVFNSTEELVPTVVATNRTTPELRARINASRVYNRTSGLNYTNEEVQKGSNTSIYLNSDRTEKVGAGVSQQQNNIARNIMSVNSEKHSIADFSERLIERNSRGHGSKQRNSQVLGS